MKKYFWIFLCLLGGILMIIGSATGSAFYKYLYSLALPYIAPDFLPLVQALLTVLEYISFYGGYSVLVGTFLILIKHSRLGKIIIMIATSFGMLGLIIFAITWIVRYLGLPLDPQADLILTQIHSLFTYNSGMAFIGTALAVLGRYGVKRSEKAEKESSKIKEYNEITSSSNSDSKFCPNCGAKLPLKANFCNKCGKNF